LVWARFPRLKAALNLRHLAALPGSAPGRRGRVRDAVTLFDECGAVVFGPDRDGLERLARHDWPGLFGTDGARWPRTLSVVLVGHGVMERLASPWKSMTGRCLLVVTGTGAGDWPALDRFAAHLWRDDGPIRKPGHLCPLPYMGLPGWWPGGTDADFYADQAVFRPPPADRPPYPVFDVDA
jgi:hypothetical protein